MIKQEYVDGRIIKNREITFEQLVTIITEKISLTPLLKTRFLLPCTKGVGLNQITYWEKEEGKDSYSTEMFQGNLVVSGNKQSVSINKDANIYLMDRTDYIEVFFEDYSFGLIMLK